MNTAPAFCGGKGARRIMASDNKLDPLQTLPSSWNNCLSPRVLANPEPTSCCKWRHKSAQISRLSSSPGPPHCFAPSMSVRRMRCAPLGVQSHIAHSPECVADAFAAGAPATVPASRPCITASHSQQNRLTPQGLGSMSCIACDCMLFPDQQAHTDWASTGMNRLSEGA